MPATFGFTEEEWSARSPKCCAEARAMAGSSLADPDWELALDGHRSEGTSMEGVKI